MLKTTPISCRESHTHKDSWQIKYFNPFSKVSIVLDQQPATDPILLVWYYFAFSRCLQCDFSGYWRLPLQHGQLSPPKGVYRNWRLFYQVVGYENDFILLCEFLSRPLCWQNVYSLNAWLRWFHSQPALQPIRLVSVPIQSWTLRSQHVSQRRAPLKSHWVSSRRQSVSWLTLVGFKLTSWKATKNVTMTMCGAVVRDRTKAVSAPAIAGGVVALLVFCMRMASRLPQYGGQFAMDDWMMLLTMVCSERPDQLDWWLSES